MSNNKQTAVDWLVAKLKSQGLLIGEPKNLVAVRQAKEMQKEQLKDAYYIDRLTADVEIGLDSEFEFNEYYEQNYGSENETDSNRLFP